jgi:tetratricopeptide (TPR) repeat protein
MLTRSSIVVLVFSVFVLCSCSDEKSTKEGIPQTVIGGYEPMLNVLNKAIEEDSDDPELYVKRANLYLALFYYPLALADAKKAIDLESENPANYLVLAKIQYELHNYIEAVKASEKCQALGSNDVELPILQSNIYFHLGDTVRMKKAIEKSEQLVPFHSNLSLLKAKIAQSIGDTSASVNLLRKSVSVNSRNLEALKLLMNVYHRRTMDDSLMYYLMDVRNLADRDGELWYLEGAFYQRRNLNESALRCFRKSIELDSSYYPTYLNVANLYFKSGNLNEAKRNYINYTRFEKENKYVYRQLIDLVTKTESEQAAIPYYEKLSQVDSSNIQVKYTLAKLYRQYNVAVPNPVVNATPVAPARPVSVPIRRDSVIVPPTDTTP